MKKKQNICENCVFYIYDDTCASYFCEVPLDEDEMQYFSGSQGGYCPYFRDGDEYAVVRKQI